MHSCWRKALCWVQCPIWISTNCCSHHQLWGSNIQVKSLYVPRHGYGGTLYRLNEHILVQDNCPEDLAIVRTGYRRKVPFFSKRRSFVQAITAAGDSKYHSYSGNPFVESSGVEKYFSISAILRKVMLYPDPECRTIHTFHCYWTSKTICATWKPKKEFINPICKWKNTGPSGFEYSTVGIQY